MRRMLAVNGQDWPPLPSDGVPHRLADVEGVEDFPCMCVDCKCARQVVIEQAVQRYQRALDDDMGVPRKYIEAPAKRRANPRRRGP